VVIAILIQYPKFSGKIILAIVNQSLIFPSLSLKLINLKGFGNNIYRHVSNFQSPSSNTPIFIPPSHSFALDSNTNEINTARKQKQQQE
jgi:hypothetical protein